MGNSTNPRRRRWLSLLGKAVIITVLTGLSVLVLTAVVLWDADYYVARDKWETFKLAMFGKWQPNKTSSATDLLKGIDEINFFRRVKVAGLGSVMTGAKFNSSEDVINNTPAKRWCYITAGSGVATQHIDLGKQVQSTPPAFSDFQAVPQDVLDELGVTADRLASLARANCQFGEFDTRKKPITAEK